MGGSQGRVGKEPGGGNGTNREGLGTPGTIPKVTEDRGIPGGLGWGHAQDHIIGSLPNKATKLMTQH